MCFISVMATKAEMEEDNTNIAARSLLTLNNGANQNVQEAVMETRNAKGKNQSAVQQISPSKPKSVQREENALSIEVKVERSTGQPTVQILTQPQSMVEKAEDKVKVSKVYMNMMNKPIITTVEMAEIKVDGSKCSPKMQILNQPKSSVLAENAEAPDDLQKEGEMFSTVTAILDRSPHMSQEKIVNLCKVSNVTAVCRENKIEITGSLKSVVTMNNLLKVLYKDTENPSVCGADKIVFMETDQEVSSTSDEPSTSNVQSVSESNLEKETLVLFDCSMCNEKFVSVEKLEAHCSESHVQDEKLLNMKGFKCPICSKVLISCQFLSKHVEESHRPNMCTICGKEFALKRYLAMHIKRHSEANKKFECQICGWKFRERNKLKIHMESHKPRSEQNLPHACTICGRKFYNRATLEDHLNTHTGNRPFKCQVCSCSFAHRIGLRRHMVVHEETKNFKCECCGKEFAFKAKLDEHMIIHTGEERFSCENCKKIFTTKSSLKRHVAACSIRVVLSTQSESTASTSIAEPQVAEPHGSDAVYMCGICGVVYNTLEKASVHAATHET